MLATLKRVIGGRPPAGRSSRDSRSAYANGFNRGRRLALKYDAAGPDEDNARHWQAGVDSNSADAANSPKVRKQIRQRARYETDNNGYLSGVVETLVNDIAGVGPNIQLSDAIPEAAANQAEADWADWRTRAGIDDALQIMVRSKIIDGESFALLATKAKAGDGVALSINPIECEQVADPNASADPLNIDGVLLGPDGEVKGYRMLKDHPGGLSPSNDTVAVSADKMLHWFRRRRPGQHRGISDLAPALKLGALLRRYSIATVRTAEFQASQSGVMEANAGEGEFDDSILAEETIEYERGGITALPVGYRFKGFESTQPNASMDAFEKTILQEIGRGLNVPLVVTLMNASGFNFASGRLDHLVYWKHIRIERNRFARQVVFPLFQAWWREWRTLNHGVGLPDFPRVEFVFPGFDFLDIARESSAHKEMIESGLETPAEYWISRGKDPEQQRREVERWAEWRRKNGFAPAPGGGQPGGEPPTPAEEGKPAGRPFEQGAAVRLGEWREEDHPRDDQGRFGEGGEGSEGESDRLNQNGLPPERLQEIARREDGSVVNSGKADGNEHMALVLPDGSVVHHTTGNREHIDITGKARDALKNGAPDTITVTHNYPYDWGLSNGDLGAMNEHTAIKEISAVTESGARFTMEVGGGKRTSKGAFTKFSKKAIDECKKECAKKFGNDYMAACGSMRHLNLSSEWNHRNPVNYTPSDNAVKVTRHFLSTYCAKVAAKYGWSYKEA